MTDPALHAVMIMAATLFLMSFFFLGLCLVMRFFRLRREAQQRALLVTWQPVMFGATLGDVPDTLPTYAASDLLIIVATLLDTRERTRGESALAGLRQLAQQLQLEPVLLRWVRGRHMDRKLMALSTLGLMRSTQVRAIAEKKIDNPYGLLSMVALRAYMDCAPDEALTALFARVTRPGWTLGQLARLCKTIPTDTLQRALYRALQTEPEPYLPALLELTFLLMSSDFEPHARAVLDRLGPGDHVAVKTAVLRHTRDPLHLDLARASVMQDDEPLRHAAYRALGRLGSRQDVVMLLNLIARESETGRKLAAQSLTQLMNDPAESRALYHEQDCPVAQRYLKDEWDKMGYSY